MGVYNGASHLPAAVDSILSQEGVDLELIVVDDGSTDGTPDLLAGYAMRDARVRILRQSNQGLTAALIHGCGAARGEFIARQDADDVSLPGRLAKQAERLAHDGSLAFVSSWAEMTGPEGEVLVTYRPCPDAAIATRNLMVGRVGPPGHGSVMMRHTAYEKVGGYRPVFYYAQDSDLWLRLGRVGNLAYVPRVLYRFNVSEQSISGSRQSEKAPYAQLIDRCHAARQEGRGDADIIAAFHPPPRGGRNGSSAAATLYFIGRCLLGRRDPRASVYFRRCLTLQPTHARAWACLVLVFLLHAADGVRRRVAAGGHP